MSLALRHPGKTRTAFTPGHRSARRALRRAARRRAGIRRRLPRILFRTNRRSPPYATGTIAYSREMQLALLQETTDEMARNGCKKIIIVNGHGGNDNCSRSSPSCSSISLTTMWSTSSTEEARNEGGPPKKTTIDMHAGESGNLEDADRAPLMPTSTAPTRNPAPTSTARTSPKTSTPGSGGTRASPIIIPATAPPPQKS